MWRHGDDPVTWPENDRAKRSTKIFRQIFGAHRGNRNERPVFAGKLMERKQCLTET